MNASITGMEKPSTASRYKRVLTVLGTRPEAIKFAPVVRALEASGIEYAVCSTGQHREMLAQVFNVFGIKPTYDLALMTAGQALGEIAGNAVAALTKTIADYKPDLVLVQGDTTTAFAGAAAAFYLRVGADEDALAVFEGRCKANMTSASHMDAGYAARRLQRNQQAADHFKAALDAGRQQTPPAFDTVTEFGIKRGIDSLERQWGLSAGAFYRGDRSPAGGGSVGQGLVEAYWQPPVIGNRDGKLFQVYGRVGLNALTPASAVQTDSLQGAVGLRYKPFSDLNLLVAGERLFPIGDAAMSDWLLRAGYSIGFNTDIQPDKTTYFTGQLYGEAAYFVDQDRFIGTIEGRYGVDTHLGSSNLLGSLYASGAYNYDAAEVRKSVAAIGAGVGLRYWFRETQYRAPSSFVQFDVMYRFKIGPSDRAAGLVLQTSLSF